MAYKPVGMEGFRERLLQDPVARREYEILHPQFEIMVALIKARLATKCSQLELAERLNKKQSAIARLEGGGYLASSVETLSRVADALGYSLSFSLLPKEEAKAGLDEDLSVKSAQLSSRRSRGEIAIANAQLCTTSCGRMRSATVKKAVAKVKMKKV